MATKNLYFTVLGPSGAGKTTLLACMYKQFERVLPGAFFPSGKSTFAALNTAWRQMLVSATDLSPEFTVSVQGTEDLREYSFTLKGKGEDADVTFYDFPGGWMGVAAEGFPYDESQAENFNRVIELVKKSSAIIVAVNTPYLMEDEGRYRERAAVDEIEYILRTSFNNDASAKMIAVVPLKCEKYTRTPELMKALDAKIRDEFASTFGLMKNPVYAGKLTVEVVPVQTAGNVEFKSFTFSNGQVNGEVYTKNASLPFTVKDADKLLGMVAGHLEESLRPPVIQETVSEPEYVSMPVTQVPKRPSRLMWKLTAAVWVVLAGGTYVFSYMYFHDRSINIENTAKVRTLSAELDSLRRKTADDASVRTRQERQTQRQNARELDELRARLKAVEDERDRALANLEEAMRSEAEALSAGEAAKLEADKITRGYERLVASEVNKAVDELKREHAEEVKKLTAEIERLTKAEADRKAQQEKEDSEKPECLEVARRYFFCYNTTILTRKDDYMASTQEIKTVTVSVKLNNGTTEQGRVKTTSVSIGALNPTTALPDSANDNIINIVNALSPCLDHTLYSVEKNNKYELSEE